MRILIDISSSQPVKNLKFNGGGEYALAILQAILKMKGNVSIDVACNSNNANSEKLEKLSAIGDYNLVYFSNLKELENLINDESYDKVIIPVCYSRFSSLAIKNDAKIFTVIHDLCELYYYVLPVKYGRYIASSFWEYLRKRVGKLINTKKRYKTSLIAHKKICLLSENQRIITVTNYSKSTLIKYLGIDPERIMVYYTPRKVDVSRKELEFSCASERYGIEKYKYFLLLAGSRWTKNNTIVIKTLYKMFSKDEYKRFMSDYKVLLLGLDKKHDSFYRHFVMNSEHFVFDDYVDDDLLTTLYKYAHLFMFPSCLEGFGMPPLEAMEHGTVPACSTAMSIPEVCGDAAIYFDPYDVNSIELSIIRSFDKAYMNQMKEKGKRHYIEMNQKREKDLEDFVCMVLDKNVH